jgi:hypothetical protein
MTNLRWNIDAARDMTPLDTSIVRLTGAFKQEHLDEKCMRNG